MNGDSSVARRAAAIGAAVAIGACGMVGGGPSSSADRPAARSGGTITGGNTPGEPGSHIVVSVADRRLWVIQGSDTLLSAPIAVGRGDVFSYDGNNYRFATPRGSRRVLNKTTDPVWRPPDWHYYEKASRRGLEPVKMERGRKYELSDGTYLEIRGDEVGRVNRFGNFWAWTPGRELIFDGKIFIPPLDTPQRAVPDALGSHALSLGDGYLIHGTWQGNRSSIGRAASHGCIRMYNEDIRTLYGMVSVGTPVHIR